MADDQRTESVKKNARRKGKKSGTKNKRAKENEEPNRQPQSADQQITQFDFDHVQVMTTTNERLVSLLATKNRSRLELETALQDALNKQQILVAENNRTREHHESEINELKRKFEDEKNHLESLLSEQKNTNQEWESRIHEQRTISITKISELEKTNRLNEEYILSAKTQKEDLTRTNASLRKEIDTLKDLLQDYDGLSAEHEQIQIVTQEMHQMLDDEARRKKRKFGDDASSSPSFEFTRPSSKYNLQMESGQFKIPTSKLTEEKVDASDSVSSSAFSSSSPLVSGQRQNSNHVESSSSPISFSPAALFKGISRLFSPRSQ